MRQRSSVSRPRRSGCPPVGAMDRAAARRPPRLTMVGLRWGSHPARQSRPALRVVIPVGQPLKAALDATRQVGPVILT